MANPNPFKFSNRVILIPFVLVLFIWIVLWVEIRFSINFNEYGILPRTFRGLKGVFLSPFIHGSATHLYNNTIPLFVLTASLIYFYRTIALKVFVWGIVLSGLITWGIGRTSFHIGASGIIYVLASFIFFKGVLSKYYRLIALSLFVVFIYGSLLWYIFPIKEGISWEGHLGGFLSGILLAIGVKAEVPKPKKYDWEREDYDETQDEFLKHFDKDGNFIETTEEVMPDADNPVKITYHYTKRRKEDDLDA